MQYLQKNMPQAIPENTTITEDPREFYMCPYVMEVGKEVTNFKSYKGIICIEGGWLKCKSWLEL